MIPKGSTGNKEYTANYEAKEYRVTLTRSSHGVLDSKSINVGYGSSNTFIAIPNKGYALESISCTNGYTANLKEDGETVEVFNNNQDSDSTCTATFSMADYKITYHLDGGTLEVGNPSSYSIESEDIILNNPIKEGYNFLGWSGSNGDIQKNVTIPTGSTGNKSYTANWEAKQYNVTLTRSNNGVINTTDIKVGYGSSNNFAVTPSKGYSLESVSCTNGYTASVKEGEENTVEVFNNNNDSDSTCTATFSMASYTITYNLDGGVVSTENPTSYTIESENITLNNPTKEGYNFIGWSGSNGSNQTRQDKLASWCVAL